MITRMRRALLALAATWLLAGCSHLDPYNVIGRQVPFDPNGHEVVPSAPKARMDDEDRARAFDFVWSTVRDRYYDPNLHGADWDAAARTYRPLAMRALDDEAFWDVLDRMTGELRDAHTRVESPKRVALRRQDQAISLGFSFATVEGKLAVTGVHPESDAWWAGVRPGMVIVSIAGEDARTAYDRLIADVRNDSTERSRHLRAVRKLSAGDEGTRVAFTFERADGSRFDARLGRSRLNTRPSASHRLLPSGLGYLRLTQWTLGVMPRALDGLNAIKGAPGIIVDLRGNPGGSLHAVNAMLSRFFDKKTEIGRVLTREGKPVSMLFGAVEIIRTTSVVEGDPEAYKGPVVVLVNSSSGSASEFFAAALQAKGRAVIMGEPTCGCLLGFLGYAKVPGGAELAYSEIGFVLANGKRVEGQGVIPDHPVPLTLADLRSGRDRRLEAAQELLARLSAEGGRKQMNADKEAQASAVLPR